MQHTGYHILCDVSSDDIVSLLRVDLQIKDHKSKKMRLVLVKVPYKDIENIQNSRERNINKYTEYRNEPQAVLKDWTIYLDTFSIGCLVSWHKDNTRLLKNLGLREGQVTEVAKESIVMAIKWSHKIKSSLKIEFVMKKLYNLYRTFLITHNILYYNVIIIIIINIK